MNLKPKNQQVYTNILNHKQNSKTMKAKLSFILVILLSAIRFIAQEPVIDLLAIEADVVYHENQYEHITLMKNNEATIAALQKTIEEKTAQVEEVERKLYRSLKEVEGIIRQGRALARSYQYMEKIGNYIIEIDTIVMGQPSLILIANQTKSALYNRMTSLVEYLTIAITGGNINLMNSVERSRLINHVNSELCIMSGLCYQIKRQMLSAKRNGILNEMLREYFGTIYRYQRNNQQIANRIVQNFHF